jgi:Na+/H+ antiporter NhaA
MNYDPSDSVRICSEENGPQEEFTPTIRLTIIFVYSITSISAFIGNIIVIIVYVNSCRTTKLRAFLINLSIADILNGCLCIPFAYTEDLYGKWISPLFMCPITQFFQYLSVFVTAITLTTISIER